MQRVVIDLGERSYPILIGEGLLNQTGELAQGAGLPQASACLVVTDRNVAEAGHLSKVMKSLAESGYRAGEIVLEPGEDTKSLADAERLYNHAFDLGLDRKSTVFALGGGVVGDLAGFLAATYMRGINFVQLPTTILAHDSSVGGKVAINHPRGKNLIGAFYQPKLVIYDTSALATLPEREVRSGLAEVIKHGAIWDAEFFSWMEAGIINALAFDPVFIGEMLAKSCSIKATIVSQDETEQNLRAILNFGHTLGHAIETCAGYGAYTHGEAVAIGMVFAAELSRKLGRIAESEVARIRSLLQCASLPTALPADIQPDELISLMRQDKKAAGGKLTFVLLNRLGEASAATEVTENTVSSLLELLGR